MDYGNANMAKFIYYNGDDGNDKILSIAAKSENDQAITIKRFVCKSLDGATPKQLQELLFKKRTYNF